jgi:predicted transposase/invertase (TIGR01784 family)
MQNNIHNLHDKFVKASFSDVDRAAAFFEQFLPEELQKSLNLATLKAIQESYIQADLNEHFSDIVFEVQTKDGGPIDLVLLFEHKSAPDKHVLVQVGHYIFSHRVKCINEKKELKVIIPLIYYQGKKKWEKPILSNLFPRVEGSQNQYIPAINHVFIALSTLSDENISQIRNRLMAAAILAQKKGIDFIKLEEDLKKILKLLPIEIEPGNFLQQMFVYIINVSEIPQPEFKKAIETIPPTIKSNIMTTYAQIKEEGKQEGILEGKLEGILEGEQKGKVEGKIEVILNGLKNGLSVELLSNITGLTVTEVEKIIKEQGQK